MVEAYWVLLLMLCAATCIQSTHSTASEQPRDTDNSKLDRLLKLLKEVNARTINKDTSRNLHSEGGSDCSISNSQDKHQRRCNPGDGHRSRTNANIVQKKHTVEKELVKPLHLSEATNDQSVDGSGKKIEKKSGLGLKVKQWTSENRHDQKSKKELQSNTKQVQTATPEEQIDIKMELRRLREENIEIKKLLKRLMAERTEQREREQREQLMQERKRENASPEDQVRMRVQQEQMVQPHITEQQLSQSRSRSGEYGPLDQREMQEPGHEEQTFQAPDEQMFEQRDGPMDDGNSNDDEKDDGSIWDGVRGEQNPRTRSWRKDSSSGNDDKKALQHEAGVQSPILAERAHYFGGYRRSRMYRYYRYNYYRYYRYVSYTRRRRKKNIAPKGYLFNPYLLAMTFFLSSAGVFMIHRI